MAQNKNIHRMAIKDAVNVGLHQSRLRHPVRDIAHSWVVLHYIGHLLEKSVSQADFLGLLVWPAEGKIRRHKAGM